MIPRAWAAMLWLAAAAPAASQDLPAPAPIPRDPCAYDEETGPVTSQLRACAQHRSDLAAAELARRLAALRASLARQAAVPSEGTDSAWHRARRQAFEEAQAAWQGYRRAACEAVYREVFPGSFATVERLVCLARLTRERIAELDRVYAAER